MVLTSQKKPMDTRDARVPPKPTTDATARFGKISATTEYIVADQPWWEAAASAKNAVASQTFPTLGANITGNVQQAKSRVAVLRDQFSDHPRFNKNADKPPPPILPSA